MGKVQWEAQGPKDRKASTIGMGPMMRQPDVLKPVGHRIRVDTCTKDLEGTPLTKAVRNARKA